MLKYFLSQGIFVTFNFPEPLFVALQEGLKG